MKKKRGRENKKGAEMTIGTIIVIILALVVLVVIIYGFVTGWGNLWQKITGIGGGKANIQTQIQSCQIACSTSAQYDYCTKIRNVTLTDNSLPISMTCVNIASNSQYGLDACTNIDCTHNNPSLPGKACVSGWSGQWTQNQCTTLNSGSTIYIQIENSLILQSDSQDPQNVGKICCAQLKTCPTADSWFINTQTCSSLSRYDITNYLTAAEKTANPSKNCCVI